LGLLQLDADIAREILISGEVVAGHGIAEDQTGSGERLDHLVFRTPQQMSHQLGIECASIGQHHQHGRFGVRRQLAQRLIRAGGSFREDVGTSDLPGLWVDVLDSCE
jgi:hypothetical protein